MHKTSIEAKLDIPNRYETKVNYINISQGRIMKKHFTFITIVILLFGCTPPKYVPVANIAKLDVSFVDSKWDGKIIPSEGRSRDTGGAGMSPALKIRSIPPGTNAVIVEFNDIDLPALASEGGHGALYVDITNEEEIVIPSVQSLSTYLPAGVLVEHQHRAEGIARSAYLAPNAFNHWYSANVMAVYKSNVETESSKLLGTGKITLGQLYFKNY